MKKIFILSFLVLISLVANAAGQLDTKKKVINRAKAIVAYHVIHHKGGEFNKTEKNEHLNAKDVDALEKLIKSDPEKKFKKICDEIENDRVDDKDTTSLIQSFEKLLLKYGVKDKGALDQVKTPIKNSYKLFSHKEENTTPSNDEEDINDNNEDSSSSVSPSISEEQISSGTFKENEGKDTAFPETDRHKKAEGFSLLLPLAVVIIALLGSLFICFLLWRKNNEFEAIKKTTINELSQIVPAYANKSLRELAHAALLKYNEIKQDKDKLDKYNKELTSQLEQKEKESRDLRNLAAALNTSTTRHNVNSNGIRHESSSSPTMIWDNLNENKNKPYPEPAVVSKVGKEMFLYLPNDGMFKEGSEEYRPGKTLYKMTYTSDDTADFEFVKKPEALGFAKQSRSRFLEGACVIENDDAESFNTIVTLDKGKLVKANEGWEIISKARIRLS